MRLPLLTWVFVPRSMFAIAASPTGRGGSIVLYIIITLILNLFFLSLYIAFLPGQGSG